MNRQQVCAVNDIEGINKLLSEGWQIGAVITDTVCYKDQELIPGLIALTKQSSIATPNGG